MKKILITLSITFMITEFFAQQIPITSQYMFNDYFINPGAAGSLDYTPITLSTRSQWSKFEGAPKTQFLGGHTKIRKKMGIGGYIFQDQTGPVSEQGVQLAYAYHLDINKKSNLSFGLGIMFFNHSISSNQLKFDEPDDNALTNIRQKSISPEASFGLLYYTKKYKVGLSIPQVFQNKIYANKTTKNENSLKRHYILHGEMTFKIDEKFDVVPGTMAKIVSGAPMQFDINTKFLYQKKYWIGLSYRHSDAVISMLGLMYRNIQFGYAYDYAITDIQNYSTGTHEFHLGLIIGRENNKKKFEIEKKNVKTKGKDKKKDVKTKGKDKKKDVKTKGKDKKKDVKPKGKDKKKDVKTKGKDKKKNVKTKGKDKKKNVKPKGKDKKKDVKTKGKDKKKNVKTKGKDKKKNVKPKGKDKKKDVKTKGKDKKKDVKSKGKDQKKEVKPKGKDKKKDVKTKGKDKNKNVKTKGKDKKKDVKTKGKDKNKNVKTKGKDKKKAVKPKGKDKKKDVKTKGKDKKKDVKTKGKDKKKDVKTKGKDKKKAVKPKGKDKKKNKEKK
jgi:type IX secretion system PorP/SprF family membrane protein